MEKIAKMQWLESKCLLFNNLTLLLISTLRIILVSYTIYIKMSTGNRNYHRQVAKVSSVANHFPRLSKSDILEITLYLQLSLHVYLQSAKKATLTIDVLIYSYTELALTLTSTLYLNMHRYTLVPKYLITVIYFSIRAK